MKIVFFNEYDMMEMIKDICDYYYNSLDLYNFYHIPDFIIESIKDSIKSSNIIKLVSQVIDRRPINNPIQGRCY